MRISFGRDTPVRLEVCDAYCEVMGAKDGGYTADGLHLRLVKFPLCCFDLYLYIHIFGSLRGLRYCLSNLPAILYTIDLVGLSSLRYCLSIPIP